MLEFLAQSDNIGRLVALLLLLMSVATWVVIFWKSWLLARIIKDVRLAILAFWQAPDLKQAAQRVAHIEREPAVSVLVAATRHQAAGSLASAGDRGQQLFLLGVRAARLQEARRDHGVLQIGLDHQRLAELFGDDHRFNGRAAQTAEILGDRGAEQAHLGELGVDLLNVGRGRGRCVELAQLSLCFLCNQVRNRRFARAGRAVEDHVRHRTAFNDPAQQPVFS